MNRVISFAILRRFSDNNPDVEQALKSWYECIRQVNWEKPGDVKNSFRHASILKNGRVVFNIMGNKYRIVARINYQKKWVFVRFVGTHKEFNRINANTI